MTERIVRTDVAIRNIGVNHGKHVALQAVSFDICAGQWLNIIGPNGAGKTSLLKSIAGIAEHTGTISINELQLDELSHRDRACWVAYVPQAPMFPPGMSVANYVLLGRTAHLSMLATERQHDLDFTFYILGELNLMEFANRDVTTLSGGERQRVAIARALAQASPLILLDEPTSALDIGMQQEVLSLIDKLRHEKQLVIISTMHDLTVAGKYPDTLLLLNNGKIASIGSPEQVLTEENIAQNYGARVKILNENGHSVVIPQ